MRLIFTNNKSTGLYSKYIVGSNIGGLSRSSIMALKRKASNNWKGKPCCISS
jgi:hypothetical protein